MNEMSDNSGACSAKNAPFMRATRSDSAGRLSTFTSNAESLWFPGISRDLWLKIVDELYRARRSRREAVKKNSKYTPSSFCGPLRPQWITSYRSRQAAHIRMPTRSSRTICATRCGIAVAVRFR